MEYVFIKTPDNFHFKGLEAEINSSEPKFSHMTHLEPQKLTVFTSSNLTSEELASLDTIVDQHDPTPYNTKKYVVSAVADAMEFGHDLIIEYGAENMLLGIIPLGMLTQVRQRMADITDALSSGAITDAIAAARAIPPEDKDSVFITDARLLNYINKCETYLGLPLSGSL